MILILGLSQTFFCLITGFLPFNSQYFNCWKCGQQCDEIKVVIIIVKEWHICYLLAFSDNWSSIWTIEKLPNCQTQKPGWVKKESTFLLVLKWNSYIVLQLVHWINWWRVLSLIVCFAVAWVWVFFFSS